MVMTTISPLDRTAPSFKQDVDRLFAEQLPIFTEEATVLGMRLDEAAITLDAAEVASSAAMVAAAVASENSSAAEISKAAAAASEAAALSYLQAYRATSYGALPSDPLRDPNGNPPTAGDEYFNTASKLLRRFNGTTWQSPDINTSILAAPAGAADVGCLEEGEGAVPRTVLAVVRDTTSAKGFGAVGDGTKDDSTEIEAAITAALLKGQDSVFLAPGEYNIQSATSQLHKVALTGPGVLKNAYRKPVVRALDSAWTARSDFSVATHAPRLLSAKRPKVVLVGDSIAALTSINATDKADNLEYLLRAKMAEACPYKEIDFVNRAVGGKRYFDLGRDEVVDLGTAAWFLAKPGRPWMEYIKDENPDVVFISFGMNDGSGWDAGNFVLSAAFAVVEKLRSLPKVPDIVFCTNLLPSLSSADVSFSGKQAQEGRDAIAGFTRSWASMMGCGYLDFNRAANALRDGRDIMDCYLDRREINVVGSLPITSDVECRDYSLWFRINNYPENYLANALEFRLSPYAGNFLGLLISGGFFKVVIYTHGTAYKQYEETTNVPAPIAGTSPVIEFSLSRNRVEILVDGATVFKGPVIRYGGVFFPQVRSAGSVPAMLTHTLLVGVDRPYRPRVSDYDIYRNDDGGNSINHVNAVGARVLFSEVIDRANWSFPASLVGPDFEARRLLRGHDGLAIDFASKQYVVKSEDSPSLNKSGAPSSIITMVRGAALEYVTDPATGATMGIRCKASLGYVPLNLLPYFDGEITVIVEAYQETTGVQNHLFSITRDADNSPRLYARILATGNANLVSFDDGNAVSVNIPGSTSSPLVTTRFNRYGFAYKPGDMKMIANGQRIYGNAIKLGLMPTGLTRLRIGHDSSPLADQSPMVIRSIVVIPRALSHNELTAMTF